MTTRNTCKTCAVGMGGQKGGMRNEAGHWPEVCKKSIQAMAADMRGALKEDFFERHLIEALRSFTPRQLEEAGRLSAPVIAREGEPHYRPIGWDEALDRVAKHLKEIRPEQAFFYSSGRASNEAGFLLQIMARVYGTNHVNNCSYYCHQASGVGLNAAIGSGTATVRLEDIEHADLFVLVGGNPASNHPRLMTSLLRLKRRGGRVIVVNPVKETGLVKFSVPSDWRSLLFGSKIADLYIQPNIGGDTAFLTGVAKSVLEKGAVNEGFVRDSTSGWESYRAQLEALRWEEIVEKSGVPKNLIEAAADLFAGSEKTIFGWTMGITHHLNGVHNVRSIVNLALMRGMLGKPHAGLLPIRGHSNVQGIGTVGVTPALKQAVFDRLVQMGVALPSHKGYDTMSCMRAADRGDMRFGLCLGGNLYGSNPDATFAERALGRVDMLVYLSTALNTGHVRGRARETIILPVLARDEEAQGTTQESMFNYVRLSDGGSRRVASARSEVEVMASLAVRLFGVRGPVRWPAMNSHAEIRRMIAEAIPGMENLARIDETREEFEIPGRVYHRPRFGTADGRANFSTHPLPDVAPGRDGVLRLMTVRSEGQFNTVVYEEEDLYRGVERRDVILMNSADISRLGLRENQRVRVKSKTGGMDGILVRSWDIRAGNALMYYPEANALVASDVDPLSGTPAFKSTLIAIETG